MRNIKKKSVRSQPLGEVEGKEKMKNQRWFWTKSEHIYHDCQKLENWFYKDNNELNWWFPWSHWFSHTNDSSLHYFSLTIHVCPSQGLVLDPRFLFLIHSNLIQHVAARVLFLKRSYVYHKFKLINKAHKDLCDMALLSKTVGSPRKAKCIWCRYAVPLVWKALPIPV